MANALGSFCSFPSARRPLGLAGALFLVLVALVAAGGCGQNKKKPLVLAPRYATLPPKVLPEYLKGTLLERVDAANTEPLSISNYGLVVNLPGKTGDAQTVKTSIREFILREMVKSGIGSTRTPGMERVTPEEMLKDPRNAIVRVDALVPAGARKGQIFDVAVSVLDQNNTSSLAGGMLYRTELKINGANPQAPGLMLEAAGVAQGDIFVNPTYALSDADDPAAKASLRFGAILGGGRVTKDRAILLRIRTPQLSMSRNIEYRIDEFYHDPATAAAFDEGIVQVYVPASFKGDWEHFVGLTTHLFFNTTSEFSAARARQLAEEAVKPDAPLLDISYCWEGLGSQSLPFIVPLMTHESPQVAFAAARAAAYLGDSSATTVLIDMARRSDNPFQVSAVQVLGSLPTSPVINQLLRTLLDSPQNTVRIEAYRLLAQTGDPAIFSKQVGDSFILDIVPSTAGPLIYASRRGPPRLAIFGPKPSLNLPAAFSAIGNRLTITSAKGERTVKIFYRDPNVSRPSPVLSNPDIAEIIARLGGEGAADSPQRFAFGYGSIVAIVQSMTQNQQVVATTANGQQVSAPFVLQSLPRVQSEIDAAPQIPEQGRPQGDTTGSQAVGEIPGTPPATNGAKVDRR